MEEEVEFVNVNDTSDDFSIRLPLNELKKNTPDDAGDKFLNA